MGCMQAQVSASTFSWLRWYRCFILRAGFCSQAIDPVATRTAALLQCTLLVRELDESLTRFLCMPVPAAIEKQPGVFAAFVPPASKFVAIRWANTTPSLPLRLKNEISALGLTAMYANETPMEMVYSDDSLTMEVDFDDILACMQQAPQDELSEEWRAVVRQSLMSE
jgi:hypothetical protein